MRLLRAALSPVSHAQKGDPERPKRKGEVEKKERRESGEVGVVPLNSHPHTAFTNLLQTKANRDNRQTEQGLVFRKRASDAIGTAGNRTADAPKLASAEKHIWTPRLTSAGNSVIKSYYSYIWRNRHKRRSAAFAAWWMPRISRKTRRRKRRTENFVGFIPLPLNDPPADFRDNIGRLFVFLLSSAALEMLKLMSLSKPVSIV